MELTIHIEGEQITLGGESLAEKLQAIDDQLRLAEAHCETLRRERKLIAKLEALVGETRRRGREVHENGAARTTRQSRGPTDGLKVAALEYLRANGPSQVRDIGAALGIDPARASQLVVPLAIAGEVRKVRRGVYEIADDDENAEPP